jgi:LysR family glycine cleavage system transcriptional activator
VAIGPAALVADDVAEGRLVQPFRRPTLPEWRYVAYVRESRDRDAAIAFRDWLVRTAAGHDRTAVRVQKRAGSVARG